MAKLVFATLRDLVQDGTYHPTPVEKDWVEKSVLVSRGAGIALSLASTATMYMVFGWVGRRVPEIAGPWNRIFLSSPYPFLGYFGGYKYMSWPCMDRLLSFQDSPLSDRGWVGLALANPEHPLCLKHPHHTSSFKYDDSEGTHSKKNIKMDAVLIHWLDDRRIIHDTNFARTFLTQHELAKRALHVERELDRYAPVWYLEKTRNKEEWLRREGSRPGTIVKPKETHPTVPLPPWPSTLPEAPPPPTPWLLNKLRGIKEEGEEGGTKIPPPSSSSSSSSSSSTPSSTPSSSLDASSSHPTDAQTEAAGRNQRDSFKERKRAALQAQRETSRASKKSYNGDNRDEAIEEAEEEEN